MSDKYTILIHFYCFILNLLPSLQLFLNKNCKSLADKSRRLNKNFKKIHEANATIQSKHLCDLNNYILFKKEDTNISYLKIIKWCENFSESLIWKVMILFFIILNCYYLQ